MDNNNTNSTRKRARIESGSGMDNNIMLRQGADIDLGAALQSNLYFTICDDISDEEYLTVNGATTNIKQEHNDTDLNNCGQSLQYRIVNQLPKSAEHNGSTSTLRTNNCTTSPGSLTATQLLPTTTTVQLPSGCEIYLVKEYVESDGDNILLSEECEDPVLSSRLALPQSVNVTSSTTQTSLKTTGGLSILPKANIKIEPGIHPGAVATNYKKRDERRRATHNEVERRRRDKINNWIFKLKEMLPKETPPTNNSGSNSKINNTKNMSNSAAIRLPATSIDGAEQQLSQQQTQPQQRNGNNCRSPPSDSKSQILIKACEYIKAMQEEVKSLRECLMENEKLRTSNHRLQNELQKLKNVERHQREQAQHQQQQQLNCDDSFDNSNNCASPSQDFAMTLCTNESDHLDEVTSSTLFATTQTSPTAITLIGGRKAAISAPYTKRELIITDYVD